MKRSILLIVPVLGLLPLAVRAASVLDVEVCPSDVDLQYDVFDESTPAETFTVGRAGAVSGFETLTGTPSGSSSTRIDVFAIVDSSRIDAKGSWAGSLAADIYAGGQRYMTIYAFAPGGASMGGAGYIGYPYVDRSLRTYVDPDAASASVPTSIPGDCILAGVGLIWTTIRRAGRSMRRSRARTGRMPTILIQ